MQRWILVIVNRDFCEMFAAPAGEKPVHAKIMERTLRSIEPVALLAQLSKNKWATITPRSFVLTLELLGYLCGQLTHLHRKQSIRKATGRHIHQPLTAEDCGQRSLLRVLGYRASKPSSVNFSLMWTCSQGKSARGACAARKNTGLIHFLLFPNDPVRKRRQRCLVIG